MDSKVLIKLIVISTGQEIDCFIPINEKIFNIKKTFLKYAFDISKIDDDTLNSYILLNGRTNVIYNNDNRVFYTDIRNGSELILCRFV